jgi:hypothetical protein
LARFEEEKEWPGGLGPALRETLADGSKRVPSLIVGSIEKYPTESRARTASMSLLLSINQEKPEEVPVPFGAVIERYLAQELPERNSTASRYRSWLKNYIKPKWAECSLDQIKPLVVEDWLEEALPRAEEQVPSQESDARLV